MSTEACVGEVIVAPPAVLLREHGCRDQDVGPQLHGGNEGGKHCARSLPGP